MKKIFAPLFALAISSNLFAEEIAPTSVREQEAAHAKEFIINLTNKVAESVKISPGAAEACILIAGAIGLVVLAIFANCIVRLISFRFVTILSSKTSIKWAGILNDAGVFSRLSHFASALVYTHLGHFVFSTAPALQSVLDTVVNIYIIVIIVAIISALLNALNTVAAQTGFGSNTALRGVAQAVKIIAFFIGFILILSSLLGKSPIYFISGLGALSAVLLLVFKDALLGFVAGIMLAANRMVEVGDWIEMPKYGADGDVIDVSLTTVKVQNWDKTITTVPSYALISDSFKNWRGMFETGGRRIKRSIYIDMQSVKFADEAMLARWQKIDLLDDYLAQKIKEIHEANTIPGADDSIANRRNLTNIGTFRAYCLAYLRAHPKVHQGMTMIVRQLAPGEHGLPLELYLFTNDTGWVAYEGIQSDIFDHLLAIISEFDLAVYQTPSSTDQRYFIQALLEKK